MADMGKIRARRQGLDDGGLNITSMMDMMTIILVFLLKSYSVDDVQVTPSDDLRLPTSSSQQLPEVSVNLVLSQTKLTVNGVDVLEFSEGVIPDEHKQAQRIVDLFETLNKLSEEAIDLHSRGLASEEFDGKILFQCDRNIPFSTVREVIYTAGQAKFAKFKFVVFKLE